VGKLQLYLQDLDDAQKALSEAQNILEVTHGKDHDLYKEVSLFLSQCKEELRVKLDKS